MDRSALESGYLIWDTSVPEWPASEEGKKAVDMEEQHVAPIAPTRLEGVS